MRLDIQLLVLLLNLLHELADDLVSDILDMRATLARAD